MNHIIASIRRAHRRYMASTANDEAVTYADPSGMGYFACPVRNLAAKPDELDRPGAVRPTRSSRSKIG